MSVICAVKKNNQICIAADGQFNFGSTTIRGEHLKDLSKLLEVGDSVIGLSGWHSMQLVFEHLIATRPELFRLNSRLEIFDTLLGLQNILKEAYFIEVTEGEEEQPVESNQISAVIVNPNGIFEIDTYREVYEYNDFCAIGSGYRYALGALHALYPRDLPAQEIAEAGVRAAIEYDNSCGPPLHSKVVTL